jgi:hypothetical protein
MVSHKHSPSGIATNHAVGVRLQTLGFAEQALVLARLAQARATDGQFAPKQLEEMFHNCSLPKPTNTSDVIGKLRKRAFLTAGRQSGRWTITPLGRQASLELLSDLDLAALSAESVSSSSLLGQVAHTVVPPALAPPTLIPGLRQFLEKHPFERNVCGMTRFPEKNGTAGSADPVLPALEIAREVCRQHGLEFHLASDRAINDDLWANVAAHMWASQYGVAFFEDRRRKGLNYNLTIEVGSMLMTGRRCALLKDRSIVQMPTDLVGRIYKSVDFDKLGSVRDALHEWIREDLTLGPCPTCHN